MSFLRAFGGLGWKPKARAVGLRERPLHDVVIYEIQPHVYLAVYWKSLPNGRGPGASLYVYEDEVLRFDCFGEGAGHYHVNLHLRRNPGRRIQTTRLNPQRLAEVARLMTAQMTEYAQQRSA